MLMSKIDGWRGRPRQGPGIGYCLRLALSKPPKVSIEVPQELRTLLYVRTRYMYDDERMRTARAMAAMAREATHLVTPPCLNAVSKCLVVANVRY